MQQIVDLQNTPEFQEMNVTFVSIAFDSAEEQLAGKSEYNIEDVPLLVDADGAVSEEYDVLKWAVRTGEPGHTFILVDSEGKIAWIKDYGSPELPNPVMYVQPEELVQFISDSL